MSEIEVLRKKEELDGYLELLGWGCYVVELDNQIALYREGRSNSFFFSESIDCCLSYCLGALKIKEESTRGDYL